MSSVWLPYPSSGEGEPSSGHSDPSASTCMLVTPRSNGKQLLLISHVQSETVGGFEEECGRIYCYDHDEGELLWKFYPGKVGVVSCEFALDWTNRRVAVHCDRSCVDSRGGEVIVLLGLYSGLVLPREFPAPDKHCGSLAFSGTSLLTVGHDSILRHDASVRTQEEQTALEGNTYEVAKSRLHDPHFGVMHCSCVMDDFCSVLISGNGLGGGHWVRQGVPFISAYARALGVPRSTLVSHLRLRKKTFYEGEFMDDDELCEISYAQKESPQVVPPPPKLLHRYRSLSGVRC